MRCLFKRWNALLSQPSLIKSHLDHHHLTHDDEILLVFINGAFSTRYPVTAHPSRSPILQLPNLIKLPKLDTSSPDKSCYYIGSANGLICFSSSETVVHVWNPSLSTLATLPDIDSTLDANDHMQFCFGYDPINDDYKVVKVMFRLGGSHLDEIQGSIKVEVYSLKRGGKQMSMFHKTSSGMWRIMFINMKRSIDYVSNTISHANKKPALGSSLPPRERRHARRDKIREEETTPCEQRHARRDKVREVENKLRKKDRTINQKHAKKQEREVEVCCTLILCIC
nr:hypothetical protein [Tanacetum cinerariifolium]